MNSVGYFPAYRSELGDELFARSETFSRYEAWQDLKARADWATGEVAVPAQTLATEWGWTKWQVLRWFDRLQEAGHIERRRIGNNPKAGQMIVIPGACTRDRTRNAPEDAPENSSNHAAPQHAGAPETAPEMHQRPHPIQEVEEEKNYTPTGARTREEGPKPPGWPTGTKRLTDLLCATCMLGGIRQDKEPNLWREEARVVAEMIREHGEEAVEQAIRGAAKRTGYPFKAGEAIDARDVQRHFTKALAARHVQAPANGNGKGHGGASRELPALGITLPDHLEAGVVGKVSEWTAANGDDARRLLEEARQESGKGPRAGEIEGRFAAKVMERVRRRKAPAAARRGGGPTTPGGEAPKRSSDTPLDEWKVRMRKRVSSDKAEHGTELRRLVQAGQQHFASELGAVWERLGEPERRARVEMYVFEQWGDRVGDPMPSPLA